jgi:hypothetical protein
MSIGAGCLKTEEGIMAGAATAAAVVLMKSRREIGLDIGFFDIICSFLKGIRSYFPDNFHFETNCTAWKYKNKPIHSIFYRTKFDCLRIHLC